jgi:hypothetical protein
MEDISIDEAHYMDALRRKEDKRIAAIAVNRNEQHKAKSVENYFFKAMFNVALGLSELCLLCETDEQFEAKILDIKEQLIKQLTAEGGILRYDLQKLDRFKHLFNYYIMIIKRKARKLTALCVEIDEAAIADFQKLFCDDDDRQEIRKEILYLEKLHKK